MFVALVARVSISLGISKASKDIVVGRGSIVNEPFQTVDLDRDSAWQLDGLLHSALLIERGILLAGARRVVLTSAVGCFRRRIPCTRLLPGSREIGLLHISLPISPCNEASVDEDGLVRAMVSDSLEEDPPSQ